MEWQVRAARSEDAPSIARTQVEAWREAYAGLMDADYLARMDPDRATGHWEWSLGAPAEGVTTHVVLGEDGVVGFAVAGPSRDEHPVCERELWALNVAPFAQGGGAGGALLDVVLGPGAWSLWVVVGNARAIGFYERRGFRADGALQHDDRLGVGEQRMVRPG